MAFIDDKNFTIINTDWVLLLVGVGIITNMGGLNENIDYRLDSNTPDINDVSRMLYGTGDFSVKNSFTNYDVDTKIYGRSKIGLVEILITRGVS